MSTNIKSNYHSLSDELMERISDDRANHVKNPYACKDTDIIRRYNGHDKPRLWRPSFVMDVEKILHNNYYNRYSDKTQVIPVTKMMTFQGVPFMYSWYLELPEQ